MKILALDIATTVGICVGTAGTVPTAWSVRLGKKGQDDILFSKMLRLTSSLIKQYEPDLMAFEGAVGGDRSSHYLVGIIACARGMATARDVPVVPCNIGAIRKHFIGQHVTSAMYPHLPKGKAKAAACEHAKAAVQNHCKMLGWKAEDEDSADACAVWSYACHKNGIHMPMPPGLFNKAAS